MRKMGAARIGGTLLALLVVAYVAALLGRVAPAEEMRVSNYGGAGTSALAALLRGRGYAVRVERSTRPTIRPGEVTLAFYPPSDEETSSSDAVASARSLKAPAVLFFRAEETQGSKVAPTLSSVLSGGGGDSVAATPLAGGPPLDLLVAPGRVRPIAANAIPVLTEGNDEDPVASSLPGPGRIVGLWHGEIGLNSRLGAARNADAVLGLIAAADAANSRRVVFWEGSGGSGLLDALGPWAHGMANQVYVAFIALAIALGSRFGLPPKRRAPQTGGAQAADALANLLLRWRGPAVGIAAAVESARRRLVSARRLPANAEREAWPKHLSEALLARIEELEGVGPDARSRELLPRIAALDAAVAEETARAVYRPQ